MILSFSPKRVLQKSLKILGLYLIIYIDHKGTIRFWSNALIKVKKNIEPNAHI